MDLRRMQAHTQRDQQNINNRQSNNIQQPEATPLQITHNEKENNL